MAEHSATPWGVDPADKNIVRDIKGAVICEVYFQIADDGTEPPDGQAIGEANAEFIVRAANSHDELVEALRGFQKVFEQGVEVGGGLSVSIALGEAIEKSKVALKNAEGK